MRKIVESKPMIIGSTAILHWFKDYPREPKDVDYIVNIKDMWDNTKTEEYLENDILYNSPELFEDGYLTKDALYTLKISHVVGWNINISKHLWDINWLKSKGCKLDRELFYKLYNYWKKVHGPDKRSDLKMSAESFFNNAVEYPHSHDFIHTLLKEVPTYTKILKDGAEVEVCEEKFNTLSYEDKCNLVIEEVMVMGLERYSKMGYLHAYSRMLLKFLVNHAPVWEAIFIAENYKELHKAPFDFIKLINEKLKTYDNTSV